MSIRQTTLAFAVVALAATATPPLTAQSSPAWLETYREPASRLIHESMGDAFAWRRLAVLTDTIGHRVSGSPQLDRAIEWAMAEMKKDGGIL